MLHEISHGIASLSTGGTIEKIVLDPYQGGACHCGGGNAFLTLSAGYLGSLFWGVVLLGLAGTKRVSNRALLTVVGGLVVLLTALYVRNGFGLLFGLGFGTALVLAGRRLGGHGEPRGSDGPGPDQLPLRDPRHQERCAGPAAPAVGRGHAGRDHAAFHDGVGGGVDRGGGDCERGRVREGLPGGLTGTGRRGCGRGAGGRTRSGGSLQPRDSGLRGAEAVRERERRSLPTRCAATDTARARAAVTDAWTNYKVNLSRNRAGRRLPLRGNAAHSDV